MIPTSKSSGMSLKDASAISVRVLVRTGYGTATTIFEELVCDLFGDDARALTTLRTTKSCTQSRLSLYSNTNQMYIFGNVIQRNSRVERYNYSAKQTNKYCSTLYA